MIKHLLFIGILNLLVSVNVLKFFQEEALFRGQRSFSKKGNEIIFSNKIYLFKGLVQNKKKAQYSRFPGCIPCKVHAEGAPRNLCGTPKKWSAS